jgi:hypothetical protein
MDLSQLSTEDLQAISSGDMSKVSEAGLRLLSGAPAAPTAPKEDPANMSFGRQLLGNAELAGSAIGNIPHGIAHAVSDLYHRLSGDPNAKDPNWINSLHVPTGEAGQELSQALGNSLTQTIDSTGAGGAVERGVKAINEYMTGDPTSHTQAIVQATAPAALDIATIAGAKGIPGAVRGAAGDVANAARGVGEAVRGTGFDIPEEPSPGDVGLKAPSNPPLKPHQQVGNTIGSAEAGVPKGTPITPEALAEARKAPGAVMGRVAAATPDGPMSADELAQLDTIGGSGVPVSGQGSIANIEGLRGNLKNILGADGVTGRQKVDWLQALRTKGYKNSASQDPGAQELGDAQLDAANILEGHIERSLPKDADVDIDQFRAARTALAKNHTVEAVSKGGNIDMAALGRMFQRNPNLLTGGLGMLGRFASENPELVGMGNRFQESLGDIANGVDLTKPATWLKPVTGVAGRIKANREAAAGVEAAQRAFPGTPPERFAPIERGPPQPPPGMTAGPMGSPPAPAGQPADFSLADVLSHGVEQNPPAGLSLAPEVGLGNELAGVTFRSSPEAVGARPVQGGAPPMARRFTDDFGNEVNPNAEQPPAPPMLVQRLAGEAPATADRGTVSRLGNILADIGSESRVESTPVGQGRSPTFTGGVPEGTPTRTGPTPKVQHEVDEETGAHTVTSKNGETHGQESGPYLLVKRTDTAKGAQGNGEGTARMEALIQQAEARGLKLGSDVSVSPAQAKVYERLGRMGYHVVKNDFEKSPTTGNLVSKDPRKPVFEVSSPLGRALAAGQ